MLVIIHLQLSIKSSGRQKNRKKNPKPKPKTSDEIYSEKTFPVAYRN